MNHNLLYFGIILVVIGFGTYALGIALPSPFPMEVTDNGVNHPYITENYRGFHLEFSYYYHNDKVPDNPYDFSDFATYHYVLNRYWLCNVYVTYVTWYGTTQTSKVFTESSLTTYTNGQPTTLLSNIPTLNTAALQTRAGIDYRFPLAPPQATTPPIYTEPEDVEPQPVNTPPLPTPTIYPSYPANSGNPTVTPTPTDDGSSGAELMPTPWNIATLAGGAVILVSPVLDRKKSKPEGAQ
jgi:hypothetical protein